MIDLDPASLTTLTHILREHLPGVEVRVFGSRVTGNAETYSDIDLVLDGRQPIEVSRLNELKYALSDSNLPILVDIVDRWVISDKFAEIIDANNQVLIPFE